MKETKRRSVNYGERLVGRIKSHFPRLARAIDAGMRIYARFCADRVSVYAAQASFFIIISAIPSLMLMIMLLKFVLPINALELIELTQKYIPETIAVYLYDIIDEIFVRSNISVLSVSAVMMFWAASRGIKSLSQGIRSIYGTISHMGFLRSTLLSLLYTLMFIIFMDVTVALMLFGRYITAFFSQWLNTEGLLVSAGRIAVFYVFLALLFTIAFNTMSGHEMSWKHQFAGALAAAGGWVVFSWGYSLYVDFFTDRSYIYGSLAAVVLLMLWLYICMLILLCGAEWNVMLYEHRVKKETSLQPEASEIREDRTLF